MEKWSGTGKIKGLAVDYTTGRQTLSLELTDDFRGSYDELAECDKLSLEISKYRAKRSIDANALLWHCLGEISKATGLDKMDLYRQALKDHGQYTYVIVKPDAVEAMKQQWRECEVIGDYHVNGQDGVQMLCYFGSSTYNTKEFSQLLDGVIQDMKDLGLDVPTSKEMRSALDAWEKHNHGQSE